MVELMVGLVIGLLISAIIITVFVQSKNSYSQDEEISKLQENGRYALQLLTRELSMSGFAGGMNIVGNIETALTGAPSCVQEWYKVVQNPIVYTTALDCIDDVKANTNILVVKRAIGTSYASSTTLTPGNLYLRTNGTGGSIISGGGSAATTPYVDWEYVVRVYYIRQIDGGIPTLMRRQLQADMSLGNPEEIVQGIENFMVAFGTDTTLDGAVDSYLSTSSKQSITAKIDILARSINKDFQYTNDRAYFAGDTAIPNSLDQDGAHYYGRVFSSTAPMRNISFKNNY